VWGLLKNFQGHEFGGQGHAAPTMKLIASELTGFEPKVTQVLTVLGRQTDYSFEVRYNRLSEDMTTPPMPRSMGFK